MQAAVTAEHLKDVEIDAIYSSDLIRARDTAEPHARLRSLPVICREGLREIYVGEWDGRPAAELRRDFSEDFNKNRFFYTFKYPGGESFPDAAERFYREIIKICEENEGKTVLVVSHSAVIRAFWYKACGYTEGDMSEKLEFMINGSYATMRCEDGVLVPEHYFYSSHVPPSAVKPI